MFENHLKHYLIKNDLITNGLSTYKNEPAIFAYYIPKEADKPFLKFYIKSFEVYTKVDTRKLIFEYFNDDLDFYESNKFCHELVNMLDEVNFKTDEKGSLRFYLCDGPNYHINKMVETVFIIRGDIKNWELT